MSNSDPIVIVSSARTPLGDFRGNLSALSAPELGGRAVAAALERGGVRPESVDEILMGCVLPAGLRQAPARQAAHNGGLPRSVGATTVNKVCGSGMKAVMLAHDLIEAGSASIVVAGGMESMSNAPYLLDKARGGYRMGHGAVLDHMMLDGLEDAYEAGRSMGDFGEAAAAQWQFSRGDQDAFALSTLERARKAVASGSFKKEIAPVRIATKSGSTLVEDDEHPMRVSPEKILQLRPAFRPDGTITAASASVIADGAAALVLSRQSVAEKLGAVGARVVGHATHSQDPDWFATAPAPAIRKLVDRIGWRIGDVDLFEINEAFAVVAMIAAKDLGIPGDRLNIYGGACALGHPIGATGARLIVTLLHALEQTGGKRGIASLCIGGGEATAIAIERTV